MKKGDRIKSIVSECQWAYSGINGTRILIESKTALSVSHVVYALECAKLDILAREEKAYSTRKSGKI